MGELEARFEAFGGVTREAAVTGVWIHEGRRYRDRSWPYAVSFTSWRQLPPWLEVVAWAQARFQQEAMYIRVAGVTDIVDFRT